ncbi:MAG TPA: hypothetical protein VFR06_08475 [Gallionellaceae bacterium]|nr:hypothetical protein [Gallionellaceae bacterium]
MMTRPLPILRHTLLALMLAGSACASAAEDVAARALKLYEKHHYEEALRLLRPQLATLDAASQPAARLAFGMNCLRNAELYQALQNSAIDIEIDYLKQLAAQKSKPSSLYVDYFLGEALMAGGRYAEAVKPLQRFMARPAVAGSDKAQAAVALGSVYWRQRQEAQARSSWSGVTGSQPEIRAALAAAYAEAGQQAQQASAMADAAAAELKKGKGVDVRSGRYLLRVYAQLDAADKGLDLLAEQEFRGAAYVESLGQSKTLSFYDADLLGSMAQVYADAAVQALEQAARDSKLSGMAAYYLADAWLLQGNNAQALRQSAVFLAQAQMPAPYREHARSVQAAARYRSGKAQEAQAAWKDMAAQGSPESLGEALQGCAAAGADCTALAQRAAAAAESGEGRKFFALNAALGKYFLARKEYGRAALYLEAGRDKANKNKIEINDPVLLAGLAQVYYRSKQFSESLEIYFEMSKHYPALRQVQDALQGIYAVEQRSAGDVKIF